MKQRPHLNTESQGANGRSDRVSSMKPRPTVREREGPLPPRALTAETFTLGGLELVVLKYSIAPEASVPNLTGAERQVVTLLIQGLGTKAIARERGVSLNTVSNQLASIYRKCGVNSREELLAKF